MTAITVSATVPTATGKTATFTLPCEADLSAGDALAELEAAISGLGWKVNL
jgi:hypothetical protein